MANTLQPNRKSIWRKPIPTSADRQAVIDGDASNDNFATAPKLSLNRDNAIEFLTTIKTLTGQMDAGGASLRIKNEVIEQLNRFISFSKTELIPTTSQETPSRSQPNESVRVEKECTKCIEAIIIEESANVAIAWLEDRLSTLQARFNDTKRNLETMERKTEAVKWSLLKHADELEGVINAQDLTAQQIRDRLNQKIRCLKQEANAAGEFPGSNDQKAPITGEIKRPKRPSNGDHIPTGGATAEQNIQREIRRLLEKDKLLNAEVTSELIWKLKIPRPSLQNSVARQEIFFPAPLIIFVASQMCGFGYLKETERFIANVIHGIESQVMTLRHKDSLKPGVFWLSNVRELLSIVCLVEKELAQTGYEMDDLERKEYGVLSVIKTDLESLEIDLYHTWMKQLKSRLDKMVIPAIIESQSVPENQLRERDSGLSNGTYSRLPQNVTKPKFSMDDLIHLFNDVHKSMKAYYLEESIIQQVFQSSLRFIGVTAFNDLLMRQNFLSWKRGLQINSNLTRIEEWCESHGMPWATFNQFRHLQQATKLLQLMKERLEDIETIFDTCWMLNLTQISQLINQYYTPDAHGASINPEIQKAIAKRVMKTPSGSEKLLLDSVPLDDAGKYEIPDPRSVEPVEIYIPSHLQIPTVSCLAQLVVDLVFPQVDAPQTPKQVPEDRIEQECIVCFTTDTRKNYPQKGHFADHKVCSTCIKTHLQVKIAEEGLTIVPCPECTMPLEYQEIARYADKKAFAKFDELLAKRTLESDPNFRWCINRGCLGGQILAHDEMAYRCAECAYLQCFRCRSAGHPDLTCQEFREQRIREEHRPEEMASEKWIKENARTCYSCNRRCEKISGCDHIRCAREIGGCGAEWCWLCGAKYADINRIGNKAHKKTCQHYA